MKFIFKNTSKLSMPGAVPAELALVLVWVMVLVPGWVSELVLEQLEQREVRPEQPEVWLAVLLGVRLAVLLGVRLEAPAKRHSQRLHL